MVGLTGLEPITTHISGECSTIELQTVIVFIMSPLRESNSYLMVRSHMSYPLNEREKNKFR
jgi:hypothetical protein